MVRPCTPSSLHISASSNNTGQRFKCGWWLVGMSKVILYGECWGWSTNQPTRWMAQNMNWNNRIEAFAMHTSPVRPLERFLHNSSSRRRGGGLHSYTITIQHSAMDYFYYYCCSTSFPHVRCCWWWWYLPRASRTRKSPILHYCGGGGWRSDSSWWRTVVHGHEWITWVEIGKYKYGMPRRGGALLFLLPLTEWVSEWVMLCIAMVAKAGGVEQQQGKGQNLNVHSKVLSTGKRHSSLRRWVLLLGPLYFTHCPHTTLSVN